MDDVDFVVQDASRSLSASSYRDAVAVTNHEGVNNSFSHGEKPPWGWDYCLSFKIPHELRAQLCKTGRRQRSSNDFNEDVALDERTLEKSRLLVKRRVDILARLKSAGFVFSQLLVPSENVILVRMSLPEEVLKSKAALLGIELKLKEEYGGGFVAFTKEREECFVTAQGECLFTPAQRMIIVMGVLQCKENWGCGLNIERLLYDGEVLQGFGIHCGERERLVKEVVWRRWWDPSYVPDFGALKDYVGARVTFYFVFVSFYARNLLMIAVLSIPIYVVYRVVKNVKVIAVLRWIFSIGLVLWTTVFLEKWKRRNAKVNVEWGLDDYKEETADDTRAQFVGDIRYGFYCEGGFVSLADLVEEERGEGEEEEEGGRARLDAGSIPKNPFQELREARKLQVQSVAVSGVFVLIVGALTFLLLWYRNDLVDYFERNGYAGAQALPGVLNGVFITVADSVWRWVSLLLTRRENHRTNQEFENSLVYKRFAFQFLSNYISLFFIAFVRPYLSNTCARSEITQKPDCMAELESQLMGLVITKATIGQIMEVGVPFLLGTLKQWVARSKTRPKRSPTSVVAQQAKTSSANNHYVLESKLSEYKSTLEDYGELVLQFGYVALFGLAFPPAALVALLNNLIEGRTDAYKVLVLSQRVVADDAADIGAWYPILECLNVLSVVTNAALVVFTADAAGVVFGFSERFANDVWRKVLYRVVAFFVMEHVLLGVKGVAAFLIPDVPSGLKRKAARREYDVARWFGIGWKEAFRGNCLLVVGERELGVCERYAEVFQVASEDELNLR